MTLTEANQIVDPHHPRTVAPESRWPLGAVRAPSEIVRDGMEGEWPATAWDEWNRAADALDAAERVAATER